MKKTISISTVLDLALVVILFIVFGSNLAAVRAGSPPPTAAPAIPTPGPRQPIPEFNGPYLDNPLDEQAALKLAVEIDKENAIWEKPWAAEALAGKSDRMTIKWHPRCDFEAGGAGPGVECGPVWVVSIQGAFRDIGFKGDQKVHNGIMYIIAQQTGHLLGVRVGRWVK